MAKKLYELLVVEPQLKNQAQATRTDLKASFEKKRHLFEEKRKVFRPNDADSHVEEESSIQSSIDEELKWIQDIWSKALDTSYQVADGNTRARDNIVLDDGTTLLENVPSTALLELEKRMGEFQELLKSVPTLDPAKGFQQDEHREQGIFKARDVVKNRTKKVQRPIVLYDATEHHPAQTQLINEDVVIGTSLEQEWSSLITPKRKGEMLERVEELRRAIKAALHRANALELTASPPTCAKVIFNYILKD